jgi:predicted nucleotidyltransferase
MDKIRDISQEERETIQLLLVRLLEKEEGILFAYLHGTFGEGRPFRDIDLAVFVEETKIPRREAIDFEIAASMRLGERARIPVDLKVLNYAPLGFQYYSTTGLLIMCKDDDLRVDFLTKIRSLYFDFKPSSERFLLEMIHAE